MKTIKVLHLIKTLNLGGAELNLFNLINAATGSDVEFHVGYSSGGEFEARFRQNGVPLFKFAEGDHRIKSLSTVPIIWRIARYLIAHNIDIIHTHSFNAHLWGSAAAKLARRKIVEHVHDFRYLDPDDFRKRRGFSRQYRYVKYLKNVSDRVIVLTKQNREFLTQKGLYDESRIVEMDNGIPISNDPSSSGGFRRMRAELDLAENDLVVLTACRIAPEKNIDLILRAAEQVKKECQSSVFLISGTGPLLSNLREECRKRGLEDTVRMIGFHPHIYDLLRLADVFLLPSFLELHSIAILEAMSMKVPVVVSQGVGRNDDFIENWKNGILLDPFSDTGWADALKKLLSDAALRQAIGNEGCEVCRKRFNITDRIVKLERLYAELTG